GVGGEVSVEISVGVDMRGNPMYGVSVLRPDEEKGGWSISHDESQLFQLSNGGREAAIEHACEIVGLDSLDDMIEGVA
ncbi:MAG: hypothetical protein R3324_06065, partial [Halobacteriales archaeon]|nr:hypothetical protein [Halobacteriales archaeon]